MPLSQETKDAVIQVAAENGLDAEALLAIVQVESGGRAFSTVKGEAKPLILYEYHVFYRYPGLTDAQRSEAVRRNLASRRWGEIKYAKTQSARYAQLERAITVNEQAAYAACSWGVGQVLGEHAEWLGYGTPKALAEEAMSGARGQVNVMLSFIKKRHLIDELNSHNWRAFARAYNGSGAVDDYSAKMAAAYRSIAGHASTPAPSATLRMGQKGDDVAALQRLLRGLGYSLFVDGDFGPATRRQVTIFQKENELVADGIVGPVTMARLEALSGRPSRADGGV